MSESMLPPVTVEFGGSAAKVLAEITRLNTGLDRFAKAVTAAGAAADAAWAAIERGAAVLEATAVAADVAKKAMQGLSRASNAVAKAVDKAAGTTDTGMASISASADRMSVAVDASSARAAAGIAAMSAEARATAMSMRASTAGMGAAGVAAEASGSKIKGLASKYLGLGAVLSKLKTIGPLSLGAIAVASLDLGMKFDASMAMLVTQAGVAQSKLAGLKNGVLDMASRVGFSATALSHSLFHVESGFASMGISSANALKITETAARGAAVGHADLIKTTTALTAVMASGYVKISQVGKAMGVLNAMVGSGEMTMDDLTKAFSGGALAVVKGFGATIQDAGAALAVFGDNNIRGASAGTMFRMSIQALAAPVATAKKYLKEFGMTHDTLAKDMQKGGMKLALQDLEGHFKKAGITAVQQGKVITDMFGKKAGAGVAVLLGQYDRTISKYAEMDKGVNKFAAAWATTKATLSQQFKGIEGGLDALLIRIGEKLVPQVSNFISLLESRGKPVVKSFSDALSGIASGFSGTPAVPAAPVAGPRPTLGPASPFTPAPAAAAPAVPKLTAWQQAGKVLASIVADLKRAVGETGTAFSGLLQAVEPALGFIGGAGLGAVKTMTVLLADYLGPALASITGFLAQHRAVVSKVIDIYMVWKAMTIAVAVQQALLNAVVDANPFSLIVLAIAAVVTGLVMLWQHSQLARNIMTLAFVGMSLPVLELARIALLVFQQITVAFLAFASGMLSMAAKAFGWMPGIGGKLKAASNAVNSWKDSAKGAFSSAIKSVDGWTAAVEAMPQKVKLDGEIHGLTDKIANAKKQLSDKNLPPTKRIALQADINNWSDQIVKAKFQLANTPEKKVALLTATITDWNKQIDAAKKQLASAPPGKKAVLTADISDLTRKKQMAQAELNSLQNKTVTITSLFVTAGSPPSVSKYVAKADGGIRFAANGLVNRQATMARAGSNILWAEESTGGESYIPHAASKRARSRVIAAQTVGILGGQVQWGSGGSGAAGAAASYATLGAAIPAGVAAGVSGSAGAAHAAVQALAKGTVAAFSTELGIASPSKKFRSLGAYVTFGLVQGLTGSTASVKAASKRIASALYVSFGSGHSYLQHTVARDNRALLMLAARRDAVAVKLKAANKSLAAVQKQWAAEQKQVADSIMQSSSVVMDASQNNGWLSATQVVQNFQQQQEKAIQFAGFLRKAQSLGLNSAMIAQIASSGVDAGYATAQALSSANKGQIAALNGMQKSMQGAANGVGSAVANSMYGAGIRSAQGLVKGLQSQEKAIEAQMMRIAKSMQAAIKRALGIRSPSRVFADLGVYIPKGLAQGIHAGTPHATGAVMSMSRAVAGAGQRSYAYAGGRGPGGTTVINNYTYNVTVEGTVTSERKLVEVLRSQNLRHGANNSQTYQGFKR